MALFQKKIFLTLFSIASLFVNTLFSQQNPPLGQQPPVTISEYTDFLNCVGATDTYGIYNIKMGEDEGMGALITRSGNSGSYTYSYNTEKAAFPITYVSRLSAIRYCNWKSHHGAFGLQSSATTETGSYDLTAFDQGADISTVILTPGATIFLPTNYLVDITFQDSSSQIYDPSLASNRLGFCIATWSSNTAVDSAAQAEGSSDQVGGAALNSGSSAPGNFSRSPFTPISKALDVTFNASSSTKISMLRDAAPDNSNQVSISLVVVGAPNNPADVSSSGTNAAGTNQTGYGSVLMPYQIGMYDVTAEQYSFFLNAVAKNSDLHGLYNTNMTSDPDVACITRSGDTNSGYTYTPISGREKLPITYVSWYSALRFCNWLENGQPTGGQPDAATENGSYDIASINNGFRNHNISLDETLSLVPQKGVAWLLPTENQWYKAAYYVPSTKNTLGKYCAFGTGSMDQPGNKWEDAVVANKANYSLNGVFTAGTQPRITPVGSFSKSPSPWGAYDMAGELNQWTSTFDKSTNNIIRGGSWKSETSDELKSTFRSSDSGSASPTVGFRVVYNIPPAPAITHLDMMKDLVPIGDPNNPLDHSDIPGGLTFGSVPTSYQIEKYDVTAEQYCMFLNAVASHTDPHNLYNPQMTADSNVACIIRYGNTNRGYSYFPWPGREKFPITYVNWFSALRFCNWLENDQPVGDESSATTDSGSFNHDDQGIYSISTNNPKWLLPTEDQWYKAAYYSPAKDGNVAIYYSFGTSNYYPPDNKLTSAATLTNSANYCLNNNFATSMEPRLTPVGTFAKTMSPYGLYDMAGEVNQWTLTPLASDPNQVVVRGGSWLSTDWHDLRYSSAFFVNANTSTNTIGFRLIYNIPPPPPDGQQVATTIFKNVTKTLYNDGKAFCDGTAGTDENTSSRLFGYITGPFIGGFYKWIVSVLTLLLRNACIFLQEVLKYFLPGDLMETLRAWFKGPFNFFFKSIGGAGRAQFIATVEGDVMLEAAQTGGGAEFAELSLFESIATPAGEWIMLTTDPPLAAAIIIAGYCAYISYKDLQQSDPRAGIGFATFDIGYIVGILTTIVRAGL